MADIQAIANDLSSLTVMQVAELELGADGKVMLDRNKYASATTRPSGG